MTAVLVIAVCILLWFSIQHWDVVSAGTRKIVKILAPILCGAVLTYLTAPAYNWVAGIVEKTLGSVTKNSKYVRGAARMLATAASLGLVIVLVVGMFQLMTAADESLLVFRIHFRCMCRMCMNGFSVF